MTEVFVERTWPRPLTDRDMHAMIEIGADCFGIHRVAWRGSLLAADGRYLVCHFSAPDAESVRIALDQAGSVPGRVWPGSIHEAPGSDDGATANVMVTRAFDAPVALEDVQAKEDAAQGCLDTHRVNFVRTFFSTDRKRMICLYRAPDAESVRIAQREANMPVDRVWSFRRFAPGTH